MDSCEFLQKFKEQEHIFWEIYEACDKKFWKGCGSYLFNGGEYEYCDIMYEKQKLLYSVAKNATDVLEIGVYMAHSMFIMLLANPKLNITCIDIDSQYSVPAVNVIKKYFKEATINLIIGDSKVILPMIHDKFDLFHIDGDHNYLVVQNEFKECFSKLKKCNVIGVFDDYDAFPNYIEIFSKFNNHEYSPIEYTIPNCRWRNAVIKWEYKNI